MGAQENVIFVFDSPHPAHVIVYPSLEWARESLETLDVLGDGQEPAFTATGQVVRVEPSHGLFATLELAEQSDLRRLQAYLREVRGPAHLADDPSAYAEEWNRLNDLDASRPPLVPERVWSWYQKAVRATS